MRTCLTCYCFSMAFAGLVTDLEKGNAVITCNNRIYFPKHGNNGKFAQFYF